MSRRRLVSFCGGLLVLISACGKNNSSSTAPTNPTPPTTTTPTITSVSPAGLSVGASPQTLIVAGTNFQIGLTVAVTLPSGTSVNFAGQTIQSLTPTSFQLTITLSSAGSYSLAVVNPSGDRSPAFAVSVQAAATPTWTPEGPRLTDVSAGFPGSVLANVSAFRLTDGRWRLLMTVGGSIRSAVSQDGLSLAMEGGVRVANSGDCGHVRAVRLGDGRIRVYCRNSSGILSYISSDEGLTLTPETGGLLISNGAVGASRLSTGGIVRTRDGGWRMYFSDEFTIPGSVPPPMRIFSASSSDLLNWTVESGVRIGLGATVSGTATHPSAIVNPDGSVSVFYTRFAQPFSVWVATSSDGLTFTSDTSTGLSGFDPDVVSLGSGLRVYYNFGDNNGGTIFSATGGAASATFSHHQLAPMLDPRPLPPAVRLPAGRTLGPGTPSAPAPARSGRGRGAFDQ